MQQETSSGAPHGVPECRCPRLTWHLSWLGSPEPHSILEVLVESTGGLYPADRDNTARIQKFRHDWRGSAADSLWHLAPYGKLSRTIYLSERKTASGSCRP